MDPAGASKLISEAIVFVNESVSKSTRELFHRALARRKDGLIHSTWTWKNRVFVKLEKSSVPTRCDSLDDLMKLLPGTASEESFVSTTPV